MSWGETQTSWKDRFLTKNFISSLSDLWNYYNGRISILTGSGPVPVVRKEGYCVTKLREDLLINNKWVEGKFKSKMYSQKFHKRERSVLHNHWILRRCKLRRLAVVGPFLRDVWLGIGDETWQAREHQFAEFLIYIRPSLLGRPSSTSATANPYLAIQRWWVNGVKTEKVEIHSMLWRLRCLEFLLIWICLTSPKKCLTSL